MIAIGVLSMACIGLARHRYGAEVTGDGETCGRPAVPTDKPVAAHSVLIPDEMQPIGFTWTFGANETVHRMTTRLAWADPAGRPAPLEVGDRLAVQLPPELANATRDRSIPGSQLNALATVTARGVELNVCVDTSGAGPGRYAAPLTFADPEIRSTPFVIDVVVKNRAEWLPLAAMVVGVALALMVLILSLASSQSPKPLAGIIAVVLGASVAMIVTTQPWTTWQNDPTWGDEPLLDWLTLMAATAFALMGAIAAGDTLQGITAGGDGRPNTESSGGAR